MTYVVSPVCRATELSTKLAGTAVGSNGSTNQPTLPMAMPVSPPTPLTVTTDVFAGFSTTITPLGAGVAGTVIVFTPAARITPCTWPLALADVSGGGVIAICPSGSPLNTALSATVADPAISQSPHES